MSDASEGVDDLYFASVGDAYRRSGTRARLANVEPYAPAGAEWELWQQRGGWRLMMALIGLRRRLAPHGSKRDGFARGGSRALARVAEAVTPRRPLNPGAATMSAPPLPLLDLQYQGWLHAHALSEHRVSRLREEERALSYRPLVSIVMSWRDARPGELRASVDSLRRQLYPEWELLAAHDDLGAADERIRVAPAADAALPPAAGEFVAFVDPGDELKPDALLELVKLLNERPELDLVYSDEDAKTDDGTLVDAFFKPDWSPDLLLSRNYVGRLAVFRKALLDELEGARGDEYDLVLRAAERTDRIAHIALPLFTRGRRPAQSSELALKAAVERRGLAADVEDGAAPGSHRVRYRLRPGLRVAIVVPTRDRVDMLRRCVTSIRERTSFGDYEIAIVDNDSAEPETLEYLESFDGTVIPQPGPFSFSALVNRAARELAERAEALLFLNNDVEVLDPDWIEALLEHGQRAEVAAVGPRLLYPDCRVQHEGTVIGIDGSAANVDLGGYLGLGESVRNVSAVTAACMLTRSAVFEELGGFDESMPIAFNDVDYCLRARARGYSIVYTPHATLRHHESVSRGQGHTLEAEDAFNRRWRGYRDPYYNPNLSLRHPYRIDPTA